jgi:hypothetical protein
MHISLRKAAALQKEILAAVPAVTDSVSVSIYSENPISDIAEHESTMLDAIALRASLMRALEEIRNSTAQVNMTSGVQKLVTRVAFLDKDIAFLTPLANAHTRQSEVVISGKIERALHADTGHYNFQEEIKFSAFESTESFSDALASLKKEKVRIQDELLELNIKNSIRLSDDTVKVLTETGLI